MPTDLVNDPTARTDRRKTDRRRDSIGSDQPAPERRFGERRRQIDPTTCEREYTGEEIEFMTAIDRYRRDAGRPFPTWSEVLEVLRGLGYTKIRMEQLPELAPTAV